MKPMMTMKCIWMMNECAVAKPSFSYVLCDITKTRLSLLENLVFCICVFLTANLLGCFSIVMLKKLYPMDTPVMCKTFSFSSFFLFELIRQIGNVVHCLVDMKKLE